MINAAHLADPAMPNRRPVHALARDARAWETFIRGSMDTSETTVLAGRDFMAQGIEQDFGLFRVTRIDAVEHAMNCRVNPPPGQNAPARLHALFQIAGDTIVDKTRHRQHIGPGSWSLNIDPRPYAVKHCGRVQQMILQIPWHYVSAYTSELRRLSNHALSYHDGPGRVMFGFMESLCAMENAGTHHFAIDLSAIGIRLFQASILELFGRSRSTSTRSVMVHRLKAEIEAQIANSGLTIDDLARRLGCSVGYLHKVYRESDLPGSLSAYILARRLDIAHRHLTHPASRHTAVSEIAFRCGFDDPSYFSRAFKARFGATPSAARGQGRS